MKTQTLKTVSLSPELFEEASKAANDHYGNNFSLLVRVCLTEWLNKNGYQGK